MSSRGSSRPLVTIGLPVFNGENYLSLAIESLLRQTFSDFELIISDNASTDRTADICQGFAEIDPRIRYVRSEINRGGIYNDNLVLQLSNGSYFKWAAHDDLCAPRFLEACLNIFQENPDVVLVYPKTILIDENGIEIEKYEDSFHFMSDRPRDRFKKILGKRMFLNPFYGLIRAEVLRDIHQIESYPSSDRVLLGELTLRGKFYEIPDYLFYRRIHPEKSTVANQSVDALAAWHDPSGKIWTITPKSRRFIGFFRSIWTGKINFGDRLGCTWEFLRYYLSPETFRGRFSGFTEEAIYLVGSIFRSLRSPGG